MPESDDIISYGTTIDGESIIEYEDEDDGEGMYIR